MINKGSGVGVKYYKSCKKSFCAELVDIEDKIADWLHVKLCSHPAHGWPLEFQGRAHFMHLEHQELLRSSSVPFAPLSSSVVSETSPNLLNPGKYLGFPVPYFSDF